MNESHEEWLARLEKRSHDRQKAFIGGIANRLGHGPMTEAPLNPHRGAPDFWTALEWNTEEKVKRFTDNFLSVGGHVERLASFSDASAFIVDKAKEMDVKIVLRQDEPALNELELEKALPEAEIAVWNSDRDKAWKTEAAGADFGIVQADHAVAYTGSAVVLSSSGKGRSVSLLPTVLFILIPVGRLVTRLGEVLETFDQAGKENLPAGIHFISGPSRSSDIENDLTIGVHGPGIVYALLIG
ncbi:hypothetical protein A7K91_19260 [Paenibacillus oryzae]|uniref:LUD domain-containing protein n=1 Tax=Paenibacillus oryzae TaxID=1844972 RepID=A0A1A5YP73_9BACL|nr:lactate utilization protein [Paenibacillus oryzae]OBR67358.1 hypothetical protein A7K91_19260 [Paenibacillus oryzae]